MHGRWVRTVKGVHECITSNRRRCSRRSYYTKNQSRPKFLQLPTLTSRNPPLPHLPSSVSISILPSPDQLPNSLQRPKVDGMRGASTEYDRRHTPP